MATFNGSGNATPRYSTEGGGDFGFKSNEAELNGVGLDLTWTLE